MRRRSVAANPSNAAAISSGKRTGHSTVAFMISVATGLRSLASPRSPTLATSNGMLPPPPVGSSTVKPSSALPTLDCNQSASRRSGECLKARS